MQDGSEAPRSQRLMTGWLRPSSAARVTWAIPARFLANRMSQPSGIARRVVGKTRRLTGRAGGADTTDRRYQNSIAPEARPVAVGRAQRAWRHCERRSASRRLL